MKILTGLLIMMTATASLAQKTDDELIKETIQTFSKAGDNNDTASLEKLLDNNYRIVMNRLFGSPEVSVVPKNVYLDKIASKEWGGDNRQVTIENLVVNGNTAAAKVTFKGEKMTFVSLMGLVKGAKGQWTLISDTPTVI